MKHATYRDAAVVLLCVAAAVAAFVIRGNDPAAWMFCINFFVLALLQLLGERRKRRRYAVRNQFECRVRTPNVSARRGWVRALATPYPNWLTLQLLPGGATDGDDPLVVRASDFTGIRKAALRDSLFRFNPSWCVASFHRGGGEVLVAAPPSFLAGMDAVTGPALARRQQHSPGAPESSE